MYKPHMITHLSELEYFLHIKYIYRDQRKCVHKIILKHPFPNIFERLKVKDIPESVLME